MNEGLPAASLHRIGRVALVVDLVLVVANVATRFALGAEADLAVYDVFLAWNLPGHAVAIAMLLSILRSRGELGAVTGTIRILLAALAWTAVAASWIIGGFSVALNLALATVLVCTVRLFLGARFGRWSLAMVVLADLVGAFLRIGGAFPDHSAVPDYVLDDSLRALGSVAWRAVVLGVMYVLTSVVANRFRAAERELRERNAELERRLAAQTPLLEDRSPRSAQSPQALAATMTAPAGSDDRTVPARQRAPAAAPGAPAPLGLDVGSRVGRYELVDRLGAGAMGVVFEARDTELDRRVAVKLVSPRSGDAETARSRLRREAQAMARLSHPNVAAVLDIGRVGDQLFIAMELVRGRTLRAFVDEARPWKETLPILLAAARGLAAAHAAGVVHRDFKPDNVLVRDDGAVRVSDFGLAREATGRVDTTGSGDVPLELVTATGAVVGTPAYLAPESVRGEADAASDQFAFAVTAFEVLEGRRPFESADIVEMLRGERSTPPRRPWRRRDLPAALRAVIERGLATDPSARWPSMAAMAAQLERLAQPRMKRRIAVLVAAIGVVSLGAVLVATRPGSGSGPRQERFWKEKLLTFRGDVHQAALSPDGTLIAAQAGGELVIIPVRGGEHRRLASLLGDDQQSSLVAELEWSPDGSTLLMSQVRPGARPQWSTIDVASGAVEHLSLEGGEGAMLSNDEIVISASNYRAVTVVSRRDNRPLRTCQVPGDYQWISDLAVAAGSVFIVVGWSDQTSALLAMDPTCGRSRVVIRRGPPRFFIPSSDGRLFSVPVGRIIDRYTEHRADGEPVGPARPLPVGTVALAGVLPDGSAVVARQATTWRMLDSNGRELGRGTGTPDFVLSPDRRQFAVLDRRPGESPTLFVVDRGEVGIPKAPIAEQVEAVAWSPTGSHLAVIARDSERAVLWVVDRSTGDRHALPAAQLSTQPGTGVQWLDDDRIAYLRADHATYLWVDRRTGETGQLLDATLGWTFKLARAPRGDALALFWMRGRDAGTYLVPGDGPPEVVRAAGQFEDGHAWDDDGQLWLFSAASIDRYDPRTRETSHVREFDLESTSRLLGVFPLGGVDFHALVSNATVDLLLYAPQ